MNREIKFRGKRLDNGEWVRVKDRLPEENYYMLAHPDYLPNGVFEGFYAGGAFYDVGGRVVKPTHWMPLPEPPKEQQ